MKLKETTRQARLLTSRLDETLNGHDMESWLELLDQRSAAMAAFEGAHRAASAAERESCHEAIVALQDEDRALQSRSEILLEQLAGEFRGQLGASTHGGNGREKTNGQACLDRKA